jgi:NAD(P)H-quinone oxidoreductase subunit 5
LLGLALLAGPVGKCAQFPLHLWLDEAMEGPLPASILRNALVVATGAWVLIKLQPVLALSPVVVGAMFLIGGLSAVGGTLIALTQTDIKRTLSYLVSAYMGVVFVAVGAGATDAALLLLLTYAVSMALLVMAAGVVAWNCITQDITQLGGLWSRRPAAGIAFLTGAVGLVALPPFGGFWPMAQLVAYLWESTPWLGSLVVVVNGLSAFSLGRVFALVFLGRTTQMTERSPEVHWPMVVPMLLLFGFAVHLPIVLGVLSLLPGGAQIAHPAVAVLVLTGAFGCYAGAKWRPVALPWPRVQALLYHDFYTAELYRRSVVAAVDGFSRVVHAADRHLFDGLVNLVGVATLLGGESLKYSTNGRTQFYALTILLGLVVLGLAVALTVPSTVPVTGKLSLAPIR